MKKAKLLSVQTLGLWHKNLKVDHYEYGYEVEKELYFDDKPYLRDNGIKVARNYESGIGAFSKYAIYILR